METNVLNSTLYNSSSDLILNSFLNGINTAEVVFIWIILSVEIPLICAAIYFVFFLFKSGQGAPVFLINLLFTDIIEIASAATVFVFDIYELHVMLSLLVSHFNGVYFMTCVALERYLLIAHPVWYRSHHPVKCLVCTSLIGWFLSLIFALFAPLTLFMPFICYIVIMFCFVGAYRALSHSQSVTSIKRQLVLASLFFVLFSYTFTILPFSILLLLSLFTYNLPHYIYKLAMFLKLLNPIMDCVLYVFMRNDVGNGFRTPNCCPRRRRIRSEIPLTNLTDVQRHPV